MSYDKIRGCWEGIASRRLGRATVMLMDNRQGQDRDGHLTSKVPSVGTSSEGTEEEEVGSILWTAMFLPKKEHDNSSEAVRRMHTPPLAAHSWPLVCVHRTISHTITFHSCRHHWKC